MHFESYPRRHRRVLSTPAAMAVGAVIGTGFVLWAGLVYPVDPNPLARMQCVLYAEPPAEIAPGWQKAAMQPVPPRPVLVCARGWK